MLHLLARLILYTLAVKKNDDDDDDYDDTPQLKHYFKHKLKMKDIMFLLLLAYKLKFVTLIPLFLGAVILLVGTTSMAGFFFALFSAALGLQSRSGRR
ncbi:hypothetical protein RUM43_013218 [Polyplax serrata]|uniref:Uncharacterized protein n=1 Tax=Polyplax serrata TaxID=468196 RepID=A0AAN8NR29_POLSC